jgi:hypothetical protein
MARDVPDKHSSLLQQPRCASRDRRSGFDPGCRCCDHRPTTPSRCLARSPAPRRSRSPARGHWPRGLMASHGSARRPKLLADADSADSSSTSISTSACDRAPLRSDSQTKPGETARCSRWPLPAETSGSPLLPHGASGLRCGRAGGRPANDPTGERTGVRWIGGQPGHVSGHEVFGVELSPAIRLFTKFRAMAESSVVDPDGPPLHPG